ncbi:MAG: hypothetical protein BD935_02220 [Marine Group III euryarchaeote CG-Epi1]|uniref:Uncharacterized protein n=1 Tax=Marine Group III euryarchaeote CG-Epi1 TaxID=1888995 RepID=A0A1J5TZN0_9ARCH|nr:MAG: hypothetical protein BD935_02220 [Marine Group III euryarchaeote CG-Epi1]
MKINYWYRKFLGKEADDKVRAGVLVFSVLAFMTHLLIYFLYQIEVITINGEAKSLVNSPLSSLYTPFSILLTYETYQLIRTLPSSFSNSVGKQYEVVTLLVVRDVFKRLADFSTDDEWAIDGELGLILLECMAFLILFFTALSYRRSSDVSEISRVDDSELDSFVHSKRIISLMLFVAFLVMAAYSFGTWTISVLDGKGGVDREIFFSDFFTILILADILILLLSYRFTVDFANLARNTGFILSTVILRVAIGAPGVSAVVLFTLSGILGLAILRISSEFVKNKKNNS